MVSPGVIAKCKRMLLNISDQSNKNRLLKLLIGSHGKILQCGYCSGDKGYPCKFLVSRQTRALVCLPKEKKGEYVAQQTGTAHAPLSHTQPPL